jgi:hypothetical protein
MPSLARQRAGRINGIKSGIARRKRAGASGGATRPSIALLRAAGLCVSPACGKPAGGHWRCRECRLYEAQQQAERRETRRALRKAA